jgi:DNA-3-methyladenine glycosylase I
MHGDQPIASDGKPRCDWAAWDDPLYLAYHDEEWGVPSRDERFLFEMLTLEGAQAGLSWSTILRKRQGYRAAFHGFDVAAIARFADADIARLMADAGIVRNRAKIESTVSNARAALDLGSEPGRLAGYLWGFVDGRPIQNRWERVGTIPAETDESRAMSRALKARGFRFVGPTICYAFMQSVGMVNDHTVTCFRYAEVAALAGTGNAPRSRRRA